MPGPRANQDELFRIAELAARGLSGSEIAAALGMTRNAVIGRCHRAGIRLGRVDGANPIPRPAPPVAIASLPVVAPQTTAEWSAALAERRAILGLTQEGIGRRLGMVGHSKYGHYETRGVVPRSLDALDAILHCLRVDGRPLRRRLNEAMSIRGAESLRETRARRAAGLPGADGLTPREREQRRAETALRAAGGYGRHDLDTIAKRRAVLLMVRRATRQAVLP